MDNKITISADELQEFEAFKRAKAAQEAAEKRKKHREEYLEMVDDALATCIVRLQQLSEQIREAKRQVYDDFSTILQIKSETLQLTKDNQRTHTFTSSDGQKRLTLGTYAIDSWRDTVDDGVEMIKEYLSSLATDARTAWTVRAILQLLAKDAAGNLKASRVLQLRKLASEVEDERFAEGLRIIEESYLPTSTRQFISAEVKNEQGGWVRIPLSVTDC